MDKPIRKLICADGTEIDFCTALTMTQIHAKLHACSLDIVKLADGKHVMLVDGIGHVKGLDYNEAATQLYREKFDVPNHHTIVGDVVVVPDADFE